MHEATRRALNQLNHAFYAGEAAADFSATRSAPWPGWRELAARLPLMGTPHVLDLGCGNGRFAGFLATSCPDAHYLGVDLSQALLAVARRDCPLRRARFLRVDLVERGLSDLQAHGPFSLVVAFGLLHHLPGRAAREAWLCEVGRLVAPGGALCLSFWQPPAFRPERLRPASHVGLAADALEPGDHLLAWGSGGGALRYVHVSDAEEREACCLAAGLGIAQWFGGDPTRGDYNQYALLRRAV